MSFACFKKKKSYIIVIILIDWLKNKNHHNKNQLLNLMHPCTLLPRESEKARLLDMFRNMSEPTGVEVALSEKE